MEETKMDIGTKKIVASFPALAAWTSLGQAEPNRALHGAALGQKL